MEKNKMILPINEKPSIITCIHHSYPCSIIESRKLVELMISEFEESAWQKETFRTRLQVQGEHIEAIEETGNTNEFVIWRALTQKEELIVKIDYLKPRNIEYFIDFFIFQEEKLGLELKMEDKSKAFRWNPYGIFIQKDMYSFDTKVYRYVKIVVNGKEMIGYVSTDGQKWEVVNTVLLLEEENLQLGIHVYLGKDSFYDWRQMNFIQMVYNDDNPYKGISLDYYVCPRKNVDNSYGWFNSYLDTFYDVIYDAVEMFGDLHKYIRWHIDHMYYVNICFDEFYIPKRADYQKNHFNHFNLFYGYDLDKRVYYIMGYSEKSVPMLSEISFDLVTMEIITNERIVRYKYAPSEIGNPIFEVSAVINALFDYLNNVDTSKKMANIMVNESIKYGICFYEDLLYEQVGRQKIRDDKRITFCILEHNKFMRERIIYLRQNGYLSNEDAETLTELCDQAIRNSMILMSLMVKNVINNNCSERIDSCLEKVYTLEKKVCELLLTLLQNKSSSR